MVAAGRCKFISIFDIFRGAKIQKKLETTKLFCFFYTKTRLFCAYVCDFDLKRVEKKNNDGKKDLSIIVGFRSYTSILHTSKHGYYACHPVPNKGHWKGEAYAVQGTIQDDG